MRRSRFGPGWLVAAAFIGPGTVTTASVAGARFGFDLLWALVFSVIAAMVLQEMSVRLALVTRRGLGESIRHHLRNPLARHLAAGLVVAAIVFGNAAFEVGNVTGAAEGLAMLTGTDAAWWALVVGLGGGGILLLGRYRRLERVLVALVLLMSLSFGVTAVIVRPDLGQIASGLARPRIPEGALLTVVALIGTTVVPYNLFLHASTVQRKWSRDVPLRSALRAARWDSVIAICVGGLVTLAILTTAAVVFPLGTSIESVAAMSQQLEPLMGGTAQVFFAAGLLAAGLTSAVTAPLAAAYAAGGVLGVQLQPGIGAGRWLALGIIAIGTLFAMFGTKPVAAILFAQAANGIILPLIAVWLFLLVSRRAVMGAHASGYIGSVLGIIVLAIVTVLGGYQLLRGLKVL